MTFSFSLLKYWTSKLGFSLVYCYPRRFTAIRVAVIVNEACCSKRAHNTRATHAQDQMWHVRFHLFLQSSPRRRVSWRVSSFGVALAFPSSVFPFKVTNSTPCADVPRELCQSIALHSPSWSLPLPLVRPSVRGGASLRPERELGSRSSIRRPRFFGSYGDRWSFCMYCSSPWFSLWAFDQVLVGNFLLWGEKQERDEGFLFFSSLFSSITGGSDRTIARPLFPILFI